MGTTELQRFLDDKSLVALRKFAKVTAQLMELQEQHDKIISQVKEAMIANDVKRIEGDWGYITLAERTNYKAADITAVPKKFTKLSLDTTKVKAAATLTGELPKGVTESTTQFITKKLKEI